MKRHSFSCTGRFFAARTAGARAPASFESVSRLSVRDAYYEWSKYAPTVNRCGIELDNEKRHENWDRGSVIECTEAPNGSRRRK